MSLLRRPGNRLWSQVERLHPEQRLFLAILVSGYDFCRQAVMKDLVTPLSGALVEGLAGSRRALSPSQTARLVDTALLGILRSSAIPRDGRGIIPDHLAHRLPELLGVLACADANHREGRDGPSILSETAYSTNPQTAQAQVLAAWGELLGLPERLILGIGLSGFSDRWTAFTTSLLEGMLTGISRLGSADVLAKGRSAVSALEPHLQPYVTGMVSSAAKVAHRT